MISLTLGGIALALALLAAFWLAYWLALWAERAGARMGILAEVSARSSHTRPTSRLGGVGLFVGTAAPMAAFTLAAWLLPRQTAGWGGNLALIGWVAASGAAFFLVGLADDVWDLPPGAKFLGQAAAVVPLFAAPLRFTDLDVGPVAGISPALAQQLLAVAWVLFFVNAYNFMDGMDGFAARFAIHACLWLAVITLMQVVRSFQPLVLRVEFAAVPILGAAASGFYQANRPPARVFMGDGGSHFAGFLLAVFAMLADGDYFAAGPDPRTGPPLVPASVVWILLLPFIFDVLLTLVRRARRGEDLLAAHRSHLYQRLMATGLSHRDVLLLNLKYFRVCGFAALLFAWSGSLAVRGAAWALALGAMLHYWRRTLARERAAAKPL